MKEFEDFTSEEIKTMSLAPLKIIYSIAAKGDPLLKVNGFHVVRAIEYGLIPPNKNVETFVFLIKTNLDKIHDCFSSESCCGDSTLKQMMELIIATIERRKESFDLTEYLTALKSFADYVACGKPFGAAFSSMDRNLMTLQAEFIQSQLSSSVYLL